MKNKALIYLSKCVSEESVESQKGKCLKYAKKNGFSVNPKTDVYINRCGTSENECGYAEMTAFKQITSRLSQKPAGSLTLIVYSGSSLIDSHPFGHIEESVKGPLPIVIYQDKN